MALFMEIMLNHLARWTFRNGMFVPKGEFSCMFLVGFSCRAVLLNPINQSCLGGVIPLSATEGA